MKYLFTFLILLSISFSAFAQAPTQTFRGTIIDKQTQSPLIGATAVVLTADPQIAVQTDENGKFRLENLPLGRSQIKFLYTGYKEKAITINLTSGKELVMNIELEENVFQADVVTVVAETDKSKSNNKTATVSARQFSIEEGQRYAGSRNDPARMAANFAGVSGANDSRNDIVIRGNSPLGVLWRLNGIDIPNPNHFGSLGSTGGPVSILNTNTLDNSDFLSGAFPAEYGNATAGVFDLKMRTGNNEKHEFLGQVGFNGFELGAEGPFSKKKKNASFLINYRYSTLEIFKALGVNFGTGAAVPQYQDITFNAVFPTKKFGKFSVYGIAGTSYIELLETQKDTSQNLYGYSGENTYFGSNVAIAGLSHTYLINSSSYTKFNLVSTLQTNKIKVDKVDLKVTPEKITPFYGNRSYNGRLAGNFTYHKKYNAKNNLTLGIYSDVYNVLMADSVDDSLGFYKLRDFEGTTFLLQAHANWQHKFNDKLTFNTGAHYQQLFLNNSYSVEPRFGMRWQMKPKQAISFGAGLHSQMSPLYVYFSTVRLADGTVKETNRDLKFTKSAQAIIAYDVNIGKSTRIKTELYYQYIYDAPVKVSPGYFSALNLGADFNSPNVDSLTNKGLGTNYGLEFTLEKFFSNGYYYLVTASVFESKYTGSDNKWRNTAFNGNYVANALFGKEFKIKGKHVLAIDVKFTTAGGKRYVPVDLNAS
ncbi:MAG: carboxypeptidase-like regulatory domain-containing protein, partial [Bacteroidia bacterium]|nr:carboxypeptidase-like regulatory domain-containing protein [Bacteroidia bacterium]